MDWSVALKYIDNLYPSEKDERQQIIDNCNIEHFGHIIGGDVARFLAVIIALLQPKTVLELGTSLGYSAMTIARALPADGLLVTIDRDSNSGAHASQLFEKWQVTAKIEQVTADVRDYIPSCQKQFDIIFQDVGHKQLYVDLFDDCLRLLKPGGLLIAEDTLFPLKKKPESPSGQGIARFNELIINCPQLVSTLLPIDDGLTVAVKRR